MRPLTLLYAVLLGESVSALFFWLLDGEILMPFYFGLIGGTYFIGRSCIFIRDHVDYHERGLPTLEQKKREYMRGEMDLDEYESAVEDEIMQNQS